MSTKTIKSNKSKTFALFILQSMFCFFEIRNNLDLRRMNSKKKCTVKLGNKKRFDKERIGIKEPFPVTNLPFTSYYIRIRKFCL